MVNYSNGIIYEIVCNQTQNRYIGSTTQKIRCRMKTHISKKNKDCSSKSIILGNDYQVNILELYPCETKEQLLYKEREWTEKLECINKKKAIVSKEEAKETQKKAIEKWNEIGNNKERMSEWRKEWWKINKEKMNEYKRKWRLEQKIKNTLIIYGRQYI